MKKKLAFLAFCLMLAVSTQLVGCGGGDTEPAPAPDASASFANYFTYNGTKIELKQNAAPVLQALGKEKSYTEEASCAFEGLDKCYFYGSFYLYTYPQGEEDFVNMIEFVDDTVQTEEGLCIGDSKDKVESLYGAESYNGVSAYICKEGDASLTVIMEGDKVSSIQLVAVFE